MAADPGTTASSNSFTVLGMSFGVWLGADRLVLAGLGVLMWLRTLPAPDRDSKAAVARRRYSELIVPVTQVDFAGGAFIDVPTWTPWPGSPSATPC